MNIRMMFPFTMVCDSCKEYNYTGALELKSQARGAGTKFTAKTEMVKGESYLGLKAGTTCLVFTTDKDTQTRQAIVFFLLLFNLLWALFYWHEVQSARSTASMADVAIAGPSLPLRPIRRTPTTPWSLVASVHTKPGRTLMLWRQNSSGRRSKRLHRSARCMRHAICMSGSDESVGTESRGRAIGDAAIGGEAARRILFVMSSRSR